MNKTNYKRQRKRRKMIDEVTSMLDMQKSKKTSSKYVFN